MVLSYVFSMNKNNQVYKHNGNKRSPIRVVHAVGLKEIHETSLV